jgi:poly-gamma-glutamate capsule biosynthesis protein CapA/YwtB (metallophosphatase superfamily)
VVARHAARRGRGTLVALVVVVVLGAGAFVAVRLGRPSHAATLDTSTTTTSIAATTTSTTPATVTLSAVGDTMLGNTPQLPPSPGTYFAPVRSALAAPIAFANLEGTLYNAASPSKCGAGSTQCYAFHDPTVYARVLRSAGFTVVNSANNHSHDFGDPGVLSTSSALRAAGIAQAGLPGQIAVVHASGLAVAFVDFAPYANTNDLLNLVSARALIRHARSLADLVVVYMHAGAEGSNADHVTRGSEYYVGESRGNPFAFAHAAIDDGADLVLASGPHVLRGMQWYRGHLIAYSLGDFANYYDFAAAGTLELSGVLRVTLAADGHFVAGRFVSVRLSPDGQPHLDPTHAAADFVNSLSRADFGATAALIGAGGAVLPPR